MDRLKWQSHLQLASKLPMTCSGLSDFQDEKKPLKIIFLVNRRKRGINLASSWHNWINWPNRNRIARSDKWSISFKFQNFCTTGIFFIFVLSVRELIFYSILYPQISFFRVMNRHGEDEACVLWCGNLDQQGSLGFQSFLPFSF